MDESQRQQQIAICRRFSVDPCPVAIQDKLGIAANVREHVLPINGMRISPEVGTCGWFIWAGNVLSQAPDFFEPIHVHHINEWCPAAVPYLALPPGWRFLIAPGHEDVWFDDSLLK
jgi:hypothetical protein